MDRAQQLAPRRYELVHALLDEDCDDVVVVDAGSSERGERRVCVGVVGAHLIAVDPAMVGHRVEGRLRHGVHRAVHREVHDVHRVVVVGILDSGRGPQRPLQVCPGGRERIPARATEEVFKGLEGQSGVRNAGSSEQRGFGADREESLVDLGVDPRDEE